MKKYYEQCEINVTKLTNTDVITGSDSFNFENYFEDELPKLPLGNWENV